ncbi:MAG: hypothetical protein CL923_03595 [Deltaproteobacteria bacterium]|nr:hypothetical protein [Deltaproteobacteria bacterium]MDP7317211.1 hypothetical protein [SAR324 cluster bacterium]
MRRVGGADLEAWRQHFKMEHPHPHPLLEWLHKDGKAIWHPSHFRLTPSGFLLTDSITMQLLP